MTDNGTIEKEKAGDQSSAIKYLGSSLWFGERSGGIYETTKKEVEPDSQVQVGSITGKPWAYWGHDNNYPQRLINAVKSDPVAGLLEKKAAFHYGKGLMFYNQDVDEEGNEKITIVPNKQVPKEILDFMKKNKWKKFMEGCIADYEWWHMYYVQYIFSNDGKVVQIKWQRAKDIRPKKRNPDTGEIDSYFLSGFWPLPIQTDKDWQYAEIPAIDIIDDTSNKSGIYCHSSISIDKDYFNDPAWHGITRWLYIASKIPRWVLANIDNSMNLKYHVEIPYKYFLDRCPEDSTAYKTDADRQQAITDLIEKTFKKMDQMLAGEKNVHKAFYSFINLLEDGQPAPGWKINVLENNVKSEEWLRAYGTAAIAMISGIGLSPSIAGSILPNGLGQGSGSDLREQFNFYIQVMTTRPREITLEPWEFIKMRNGWPDDLHVGYRDIVLQSVDQNKSGNAVQNEQSPTSDKQQSNTMSV
jgi:hypothetical protein